MVLGLIHPFVSLRKPTRWVAKDISRPGALKYDKLEKNDAFIKTKLSVLNCAGSFSLNEQFAEAIKSISKKEISKLKFKVDYETKQISVSEHLQLTVLINNHIKEIPEFFYNFRPKTNENDLPNHVLGTFQQVLLHPKYQSSSPRAQRILRHSALGHDTGKTLDSTSDHAALSARMIAKSLEKTINNKKDAELILKLITHHHYSWNIKNKIMTYQDYAGIFNEEEFKLLKILIDSDILSKPQDAKNAARLKENEEFFARQVEAFKAFNPQIINSKTHKIEFVA